MDPVEPLILDLLGDLRSGARPVRDVLDAWRTSCPRLPVWEEALDRGLIERYRSPGVSGEWVRLTNAGNSELARARPGAGQETADSATSSPGSPRARA